MLRPHSVSIQTDLTSEELSKKLAEVTNVIKGCEQVTGTSAVQENNNIRQH